MKRRGCDKGDCSAPYASFSEEEKKANVIKIHKCRRGKTPVEVTEWHDDTPPYFHRVVSVGKYHYIR